jgi:hypothetical protein
MVRKEVRMRTLALWAGLAALGGGCAPMTAVDLPNGDHVVTTYVRIQGADEARNDNLWAARQRCHGGVVLIREESGVDDEGAWRRLVYGCLTRESVGRVPPR